MTSILLSLLHSAREAKALLIFIDERKKIVNPQEAWNAAFYQLQLQFDRASFDTWLRGSVYLGFEDGVFVIGARNTYAREMLQHRLYRNVRRILSDVYGDSVEVRFEVHKAEPVAKSAPTDTPLFRLLAEQEESESFGGPLHEHISRPQHPDLPESELNPRFTFERFIANKANRMTLEAALAVAENPASTYNPLLIYGGVGLGKTHLLQAVAHVCQSKGMRVLYIPSEAFTNDLIHAIRQRTTAMFRDKYRSTDVLLVDDIQFISGKESTQEEFFHTFNALYTFNKQVILASDRHPRELKTLEDRLRSRFEGGLVVDVQPPEYETRIAILNMWANERGVELPEPVIEMMAQRAQSNIRSLEGVFNQVVAKAHLTTRPLSLQSAQSVLERFERPRQHGRKPTLEQVLAAAAAHHGLHADDITGKKRTAALNSARQIAMYLARELTDASLTQIGDTFGRSHTTVIHGCNKVEADMSSDPSLKSAIDAVRNKVIGG